MKKVIPAMPLESEILFEFFGDEPRLLVENVDYAHYVAGELRVCVTRKPTKFLVSVDLERVYNKVRDCPIHFLIDGPLSRRKKNRIFQAIRNLQSNKEMAGQFWGYMQGYEDLSNQNYYQLQ